MSTSASLQGTRKAAEERRAFPRRSVMDRRLVTVNLDNLDAGLMVDLSEKGMAVQALARIKPGASTSLQFELPDTANRIEARGTVVWVDATSGRAGIRFESLSEAATGALKKWLWLAARDRPKPASAQTPPPPALPAAESRATEVSALQREISSRGLDRDAALTLIADRISGLTRADGVAILLGDSKAMTCRASTGSAPPVGTDLLPQSGLSGECVRTGVTVRCEDTEQDGRVNREACRAINLRSAIIMPLFARGNINGLVEVFYTAPCAFDGRDVLSLRRMADLISATLSNSATAEPEPLVRGSSAASAPPAKLAPVRSVNPGATIPSVPLTVPQPDKVACQVCGHRNPPAARSCEKCQGPLAGSFKHNAEALPWLTLRLNASPRLLILIALLLLLIGIWGWREYKSRGDHDSTPVSTTSPIDRSRSPLS
ncbi:MAG TPA: GAF domain-containing protein [Terriglobales bacterium]|nr:GAF domain-containing protein [Terriglobales bacterium]